MTFPTITTLPGAPSRGIDNSTEFSNNTDAFLTALVTFSEEMNTAGDWIDETSAEVEANAEAAADSASAATAAANYKGDWTIVTNVLQGESYSYGGSVWIAKVDSVGQTPVAGTYWFKGAGTAASADLTTSSTDTTSGRITKNGDVINSTSFLTIVDCDDMQNELPLGCSTHILINSSSTSNRPKGSFGYRGTAYINSSATFGIVFAQSDSSSPNIAIRTLNSGVWTDWFYAHTTNNNATSFDIDTGTSTDLTITPVGLQGSTKNPENRIYKSAAQTISSGGSLSLSHGLGATPIGVEFILKCTTADQGHAVGDEIVVSTINNTSSGTTRNNSVVVSDSTIIIRFSSDANVFLYANKSTGASGSLLNSNWQLYVRAWY